VAGVALTAALMAASSTARAGNADPDDPLRWDLAWTHAGPADYTLSGVGLGALALEAGFLQSRQPPLHWRGPILFDQAVRDLLRGSTAGVRDAAAAVSWSLLGLEVADPLFIDVAYAWKRYGRGLAWDLFWQDATAISLASAADLALRDLVGRARPPVSDCLAAGGSTSHCLGSNPEATRSFPGGHIAIATTAAALVCTQHLSLHLYGPPWDALACGAAVTVDAAIGTLRLVTDNHWATDIVAGSAFGLAVGWGVPVLMHLQGRARSQGDLRPGLIPAPIAVRHGAGLAVTGWF
jgi:membrane-associated phospholipid phosphatase